MVIKPHIHLSDFSDEVRFVVAVDVAAPPAPTAIDWLARAATICNVNIDLVYAGPQPTSIADTLQQRKYRPDPTRVLQHISKTLRSKGVHSTITLLEQTDSPAHALVEFSDQRKAWATITLAAQRSIAWKLLLGSTARRILALTKRPFISLRPGT